MFIDEIFEPHNSRMGDFEGLVIMFMMPVVIIVTIFVLEKLQRDWNFNANLSNWF